MRPSCALPIEARRCSCLRKGKRQSRSPQQRLFRLTRERKLLGGYPGRTRQLFQIRAHGCCHSFTPAGAQHPKENGSSWPESVTLSTSVDEDDHCHAEQSWIHRVLRTVLGAIGLLQLADLLEEKVWVSFAITALFLVGAASGWLAGGNQVLSEKMRGGCIAGVFALAGIPELVELLFNVTAGCIDTHVLMTLACFGTLAIGSALEGALLLVLFQVSHTLEHVLTKRAQGNLQNLFDRVPDEAILVELDAEGEPRISEARSLPAADISTGSNMLVRPGQQVALDGEIIYGEALVSTEHITGEALPARRRRGDEVPAGALNHDGVLVVRASRSAAHSTPARIARLTQYAQARKPHLGRWLDSFGEIYARSVIAATVTSFLALLVGGVPLMSAGGQRGAFYRALGLLTTASPCALVLVPLAYVSAIATVTHRGILIKGGRVLDALVQCSTIAFDKTGTLTTGNLACTGLISPGQAVPHSVSGNGASRQHWAHKIASSGSREDVLALSTVIALSQRASHPVSRAAAALAQDTSGHVPHTQIDNFKLVPGAGVQGTVMRNSRRRDVRFGSLEFAAEVLPPDQAAVAADHVAVVTSDSVVSVLVDAPSDRQGSPSAGGGDDSDILVRILTFSDTVHARSASAIKELQQGSWNHSPRAAAAMIVVMLTGDNEASARRIGRVLGISNVQAGLSPQQKLQAVENVRASTSSRNSGGCGVIMVGDGINDAPALAAAEVGVAVAETPSEAAASASDVLLLTGEGIAALPFLLRTAHKTQAVVKQNLALAVGAILALSLPVLWGAIPLWTAVALHEGSTLLVALNCLRLLYSKDKIDAERRTRGHATATLQEASLSLEPEDMAVAVSPA